MKTSYSMAGLCLAALCACSPSPTEQAEAFSRFVAGLCEAECSRNARCGVIASYEECAASARNCSWSNALAQEERQIRRAILSGRLKFDAVAADRAGRVIREAACEDPLPFVLAEIAPFVGTVGEGGACYRAREECRDGLYCDFAEERCPGECRPARVHRAGESVAYTAADQCERGLATSFADGLMHCFVPASEGGACSDDFECLGPFYCAPDAGVCARRPGQAEACGPQNVCELPLGCVDGVCERTWAGRGEPCADSGCPWDLVCRTLPGAAAATCEPYPRAGEACGGWTLPCYSNLYCLQGVCEAQLGPGATCEPPVEYQYPCQGRLTCSPSSRTCVAIPEEGQPCEVVCGENQECRDGICQPVGCYEPAPR